jgi:hypothetical protein
VSAMSHPCPDCDTQRTFITPHDAGLCPDSEDGRCPEWCCTECGAALLTSFHLPGVQAHTVPESAQRVA